MSDPTVLDDIETTTKKGFDLLERLKNRGLRRGTITLFTDDEKGVELGWAYDLKDTTRTVTIRRERGGFVGELDGLDEKQVADVTDLQARIDAMEASEAPAKDITAVKKTLATLVATYEQQRADLNDKIKELTDELTKTALVVKMRAVPPIIQKDTRRKAREKMGLTEKGVPEDRVEEFNLCTLAYLMTVMFESVTDNETGAVNTETTYDDAVALMDYLPVGQFQRLNDVLGTVQFTDAISRSIEGQEDFS